MREIFADSGYWTALIRPRDELHQVALRITDELPLHRIVTTEMILVELLNAMSRSGQQNRELASRMVTNIYNDTNVEVVPQTSRQFREAAIRYAYRLDQRWGVTDCASFLLMEERGITEALAYDRDFEQAGFAALLRDADSLDRLEQ